MYDTIPSRDLRCANTERQTDEDRTNTQKSDKDRESLYRKKRQKTRHNDINLIQKDQFRGRQKREKQGNSETEKHKQSDRQADRKNKKKNIHITITCALHANTNNTVCGTSGTW